jgi:transposase InsO family protein
VVSWSDWAEEYGLTPAAVAARLHLVPRTLRHWRHHRRPSPRPLVLRGRPLQRAPVPLRNAVLHWLDAAGPATGLPALQAGFPELARAELADLLTRYRRVWRRRHGQALHVLHWTAAGAVWALDFAEAPRPVEGVYPYLLAVRDLGSGRQLLWLPVAEATASVTIAALASLVALYGAPLVLKADNGAAFRAAVTQAWAAAVGMELLYSPPGLPAYNGSIEAGIGALKWRTEWWATRRGYPSAWTWDDVEGARQEANAQARPRGRRGPTPDEAWASRCAARAEERDAFRTTVAALRPEARRERGLSETEAGTEVERRGVDRVAIRRALVAHGLLLFTRRRIPLPIRSQKTPRIT